MEIRRLFNVLFRLWQKKVIILAFLLVGFTISCFSIITADKKSNLQTHTVLNGHKSNTILHSTKSDEKTFSLIKRYLEDTHADIVIYFIDPISNANIPTSQKYFTSDIYFSSLDFSVRSLRAPPAYFN